MRGGLKMKNNCYAGKGLQTTNWLIGLKKKCFFAWNSPHLCTQVVPGFVDYLIQVVEEDYPEVDPKEDPDEDPKEEMGEDHREGSETGSNIYDPRDGRVIDMSPEYNHDESPEYYPGPYYDMGDDAPTWP
ncbi:hypothetical protein H5410_041915 [Solanum commersonii]|uniref:Uncharacterized protein n=1 Tax=Solanum commersonii TaxID=4109 RepID=A0A9J5XT95_SOLCO|nr:hypothetical protein H5410_041915 [Solanum commersonii]